MGISTPILFCIFNRPDKTVRVFEAIARCQPERLLVVADGPRVDRPGERERVQQTRKIVERVDWPCEVTTHFSETNLGCRDRMASGLDWAFAREERLIVLEDDCLPDDSFFGYAEALLERYADCSEVMMISGDNFQPERRTGYSYYFSRWTHIWGWASWRRAWKYFDVGLSAWPEVKRDRLLVPWMDGEGEYDHWCQVFDAVYRGEIDTWDFSWMFACWQQRGLTILPEVNLVSNIGFDASATHTVDPESRLANLGCGKVGALVHPPGVERHVLADRWTYENIFRSTEVADRPARRSFLQRLLGKLALG